jgi:hypothetical protein
MIKNIHPEETFGTDFSLVAAIRVPFDEISQRGLEVTREQDDLDVYECVAFTLPDRGMLMLQHYLNTTDGTVTLLLADNFKGLSDLPQTLRAIAAELGIPVEAFRWRQNGEDVSLAPSGRVAA